MKNKISKLLLLLIAILQFISISSHCQEVLNIDSCYQLARDNFPLSAKFKLIEQSDNLNISALSKGYLPQIKINAQATYQSDAITLPLLIPGINIESIDKDQYKIYVELIQNIYDGGITRNQKRQIKQTSLVEKQQLDVDLYKLREKITDLYFGIILLRAYSKQTQLYSDNVTIALAKVRSNVENGVVLLSEQKIIEQELIKIEQKQIELSSSHSAYLKMLGLFLNKPLNDSVKLSLPIEASPKVDINRPELAFFDSQKQLLLSQVALIKSQNIPKLMLFGEGGYGRPSLNFFENKFNFYYIAGIRLTIPISGFYTQKNKVDLIKINNNELDISKQLFLFDINLKEKQNNEEINKLTNLIASDTKLLDIRKSIRNTIESKLENGIITSSDYIKEINDENIMNQNKLLHEIQLLLARYKNKILMGN